MGAPTVGRVVHVPTGEGPVPALITRVNPDGTINLRVLTDSSDNPPHWRRVPLLDAPASDLWPAAPRVAWWPTPAAAIITHALDATVDPTVQLEDPHGDLTHGD